MGAVLFSIGIIVSFLLVAAALYIATIPGTWVMYLLLFGTGLIVFGITILATNGSLPLNVGGIGWLVIPIYKFASHVETFWIPAGIVIDAIAAVVWIMERRRDGRADA